MRYFLVIIFLSIYTLGHGQKLKLGFRSGVSFSNFYSHSSSEKTSDPTFVGPIVGPGPVIIDPDQQSLPSYYYKTDFIKDMRIGFFSCLHLNWKIKQRLSAGIGLGYSQKGIDMDYSYHSTYTDEENNTVKENYRFISNLRLDYITVPATVQYMLDRKERFYVLGGIYHSVVVNSSIKQMARNEKQTTDPDTNLATTSISQSLLTKAYTNLLDAGLVAGVGVNWPLTEKLKIGLDIRSALGVTSIPAKYEDHGFMGFSKATKNLSFETGLTLQYVLK